MWGFTVHISILYYLYRLCYYALSFTETMNDKSWSLNGVSTPSSHSHTIWLIFYLFLSYCGNKNRILFSRRTVFKLIFVILNYISVESFVYLQQLCRTLIHGRILTAFTSTQALSMVLIHYLTEETFSRIISEKLRWYTMNKISSYLFFIYNTSVIHFLLWSYTL
jgi:hypothetical protein